MQCKKQFAWKSYPISCIDLFVSIIYLYIIITYFINNLLNLNSWSVSVTEAELYGYMWCYHFLDLQCNHETRKIMETLF